MAYRILFIDEQKKYQNNFLDYVEQKNIEDVEAIVKYPESSIDDLINVVYEELADAVVTDFRLNEYKTDIKYNIDYDGADLLHSLRERRKGFPCFILTSYDGDAVEESQDVNVVYDKGVINPYTEKSERVSFLEKIIKQIDHYRKTIDNAEKELCDLIEKRSKEEASLEDEERLIELDNLLESSVDRRGEIPAEFKKLSNQSRLSELIKKADEIISKYETIS